MRKLIIALLIGSLLSCNKKEEPSWVDHAIDVSGVQYKKMAEMALAEQSYPRSVDSNGSIKWVGPHDWTSGFFPGSLFYLFELTGDSSFYSYATRLTESLQVLEYDSTTHDLGFMIYCSFGNQYRLQPEEMVAEIMINGANSLSSRFNETIGCIRSWDFGSWQFPVIIDNMMNLEFLFWATKYTGDQRYADIAIQHAQTTMKNHFRQDFSSYHVLDYDTLTGNVLSKETFQGYSDESAWSRGQAWGLYGFTVVFRETRDSTYLEQAKGIADFILDQPNLPVDKIPYWDFNDPDIPETPRDASAAAVMASAFLELSQYIAEGDKYESAAREILKNLSSSKFLAEKGNNNSFILMHSTGFKPENSEVDVPLNYADYYYLEALKRYLKLKNS